MRNNYPKEIQEFIAATHLLPKEELLLFDAEVQLRRDNSIQSFTSQVHIISMPHATAVYVYEFFKTSYKAPEMYSSEDYVFTYHQHKLEIRPINDGQELLLSIKPATNSI